MNKHMSRAVLATACALISGLMAVGCSRSGGSSGNGSVTTTGLLLRMSINNLGAQPIGMAPNANQSYGLTVSLVDNLGNVTSLSNTAYTLSPSSSNPSVADASKDTQNTLIVTSRNLNGDATITATVGYQGASVSQSFNVRVSGASGNNPNNPGGPTNPNFTIILAHSKTMPMNVNEVDDITVSVTQTGVSGTTQLLSNQFNLFLDNNPNNIGVVQVKDSNRWEFRGNNNSGNADIRVQVTNFNGNTFSQTFPTAIQVTVNGGGGTGNNAGTIYNNLVLSASGSPATGVPFAIGVQADKGAGLSSVSMDNERIYARIKNPADVEAGRAVIDANGNLTMLNGGVTVDIEFDAMGPVQNLGSSYLDERWNLTTVSNTLSLTASGNMPQTKLFFRYLRGACAPGMMRLGILDPQTFGDVTANVQSAGGLTFSDVNAFEYVNGFDDTGTAVPMLKVKKFGRFWVQATFNGKTSDKFYVLVTPFGDRILKEGSRYVHDTHVSFARPFRNPLNSGQRMMKIFVNLTRCGAGNIGTTSLFLEDVGNGTGKTMPTMTTPDSKSTDADGTIWGVYDFVYTLDSGSQDVADFNYLGSGPNPFDPNSSANKWPQDTVFSRLWSGSISSNGVFRARVFKNATLSLVTVEARP